MASLSPKWDTNNRIAAGLNENPQIGNGTEQWAGLQNKKKHMDDAAASTCRRTPEQPLVQ